jgi:hypothetical protein
MKIKYLFFIRNIRLVKSCALWKQDPSSNWRWKILIWFILHIINICSSQTFTLENSKKKGPNILLRPRIHSLCLLFRSTLLAKTVFPVRNKLPATSALSKKNYLTAKKTKRFNLIQIKSPPPTPLSSISPKFV